MKIRKRIGAFLLDMFIVMMVTVSLSNLSYLNPYKHQYNDASKEYINILDEYENNFQNLNKDEALSSLVTYANEKMLPQLMIVEKYNLFNSLWYIIIFILYNVVFAYFNKGQTLGKKIFKLKVTSKDESAATFIQLLTRSLFNGSSIFFGINIVVIIRIIISIISNKYLFLILFYGVEAISFALEISLFVTLFTSKGNRLTSDYIAKTQVLDVK